MGNDRNNATAFDSSERKQALTDRGASASRDSGSLTWVGTAIMRRRGPITARLDLVGIYNVAE